MRFNHTVTIKHANDILRSATGSSSTFAFWSSEVKVPPRFWLKLVVSLESERKAKYVFCRMETKAVVPCRVNHITCVLKSCIYDLKWANSPPVMNRTMSVTPLSFFFYFFFFSPFPFTTKANLLVIMKIEKW